MVPSAEVKWANSVAKTAAIVQAAGKSIAVEVAFTRTATAGRVIAAACYANPAACAIAAGAVGIAAWYATSRMVQDEATNTYAVEYDEWGWYYTTSYSGLTNNTYSSRGDACSASAAKLCVAAAGYCGVYSATIRAPEAAPPASALCDMKCNKLSGFPAICNQVSGVTSATVFTKEGMTQKERPATAADHEAHADANPVPDRAANESPVPVPVVQPEITSEPTPVGDPYPGDDSPEVGPWKQDQEKVAPIPETGDPTDVEVTPETKDADNPNTPEDEGPPDDVVEPPPTEPETVNQCELNPNTVGCAEVGTAPTDEVQKESADLSWSAEAVGLPVGCPAPITMGNLGTLTFQSACEAATWVRPLVIAMGAFIASLMVVAAVRRG